jgi:hypothetical protein
MKKFKDLKTQVGLHESGEHTFGGGVQAPSGTPQEKFQQQATRAFIYIQRNSQLNRINAFLDAFSRKEYIEPRGALGNAQSKIEHCWI